MWRVTNHIQFVEMGEDTFAPTIKTHRIPPLLHHMSPTEQSLPIEWQHSYDSCRGVHQRFDGEDKYTFKLWRDEPMRAFIEKEYPWFLDTYDAYPQEIQRVDAARYFILRKFGGMYLDLDVGCRRSLDNLRRLPNTGMIFPETSPFGISNDFMMAAPDHPFMVFVTERLKSWAVVRPYSPFLTVMLSTGPAFLSIAAFDFISQGYAAAQDLGLMSYLDYTKRVLFHLPGSSWLKADGVLLIYVFNNLFLYLFVIGACFYCRYLHRNGELDRLAKRANLKNVHTAAELVEVLAGTGIDRMHGFAANQISKLLPRHSLVATQDSSNIPDVEQAFASRAPAAAAKSTRIRPSRQPSRWRHGERDKDSEGRYLPEEGSLSEGGSDGETDYSDADERADKARTSDDDGQRSEEF